MYGAFKSYFRVAPSISDPIPEVTSSAESGGIFEAVSDSISSVTSAVDAMISPEVIPGTAPEAISKAVPEAISSTVPAADTMEMLTTSIQAVVVAASVVTLMSSKSSRAQKSLSVLLMALFAPTIWSLIPATPFLESLFITIGNILTTLWALMIEIYFEGSWANIWVLFPMLFRVINAVFFQSRFLLRVLLPLSFLLAVYLFYRGVSNAYDAYVDLGRGGTPTTFRGWLRVFRLRNQARLNVLQPPRVPPFLEPYRGRLYNLPQREGPRPTVKGVAPQRQVDQKASPSTFFRLSQMLRDEADKNPQHVRIATSFLEGHLSALRKVIPEGTPLGKDAKGGEWEFGGEIAHPHRLDGSMHIVLHPEDVRTVIEAGWGERHPLAIATWFWKLCHWRFEGNRRPVPEYLVILYAPLTAEHYHIYERIIQAAMWFTTAGELYPIDENTYPVEN